MRALLIKYLTAVRNSYWFLPSLMALGAGLLAALTTYLDRAYAVDWIVHLAWLDAGEPEGARALLSTIAGSMITVAGVTFSITIAAVSFASGQFGPRILSNFMGDRGNQITLGTFIATFVYCLLVLRTVHNGSEGPEGEIVGAFVPHLSTLCGFGLALASIAVLIFFVHHIPESIHISNVVAGIGRGLLSRIDDLFGAQDAVQEARDELESVQLGYALDEAALVSAGEDGYIQAFDEDGLVQTATQHDLFIRMLCRPGEFVSAARPLLAVWPSERVDGALRSSLQSSFALGRQRTQAQDLTFFVDELVEIAARALSPGVNDPFTAMSCIDWLGAALARVARAPLDSSVHRDARGTPRLALPVLDFDALVDAAVGQLRPYAQSDRNAALHLLRMLGEVMVMASNEAQRATLAERAVALRDGALDALPHPDDCEAVQDRAHVVLYLQHTPDDTEALVRVRGRTAARA